MQQRMQENPSGPQSPGGQPSQPDLPGAPGYVPETPQDDEARRPVVYRSGKLPKDLPAWFEQLDTDQDGQVGLYEWVQAGHSPSDFKALDRNDDGFLTAEELLGCVREANKQPESAVAMALARAGGTGGGSRFAMGGGPGGPGGGFGRFGGPGSGPGGMGGGPMRMRFEGGPGGGEAGQGPQMFRSDGNNRDGGPGMGRRGRGGEGGPGFGRGGDGRGGMGREGRQRGDGPGNGGGRQDRFQNNNGR
jgi:hypothetical protein